MKTTWKAMIAVLAVSLLTVGLAFAKGPDGQGNGRAPLTHLQKQLGLSQEQVDKLKPIFQSWQQQQKAHREAWETKLHEVLTADQQAQLDQMKAQRLEARKEGRKEGCKEGRKEGSKCDSRGKTTFEKKLALTADQKAQLKAFHQQNAPQMKAEREQHLAQIREVLTPDQQARFEKMMKRHGAHHGQDPAKPAAQPTPGS
jgi:Spy/CpxP family protein refolding chaperone